MFLNPCEYALKNVNFFFHAGKAREIRPIRCTDCRILEMLQEAFNEWMLRKRPNVVIEAMGLDLDVDEKEAEEFVKLGFKPKKKFNLFENWKFVYMDFERAEWKGFLKYFGWYGIKIVGCGFHFVRALMKNMKVNKIL